MGVDDCGVPDKPADVVVSAGALILLLGLNKALSRLIDVWVSLDL
jgi:hypothetical protein